MFCDWTNGVVGLGILNFEVKNHLLYHAYVFFFSNKKILSVLIFENTSMN
jgi:hypothetical protein